MISKHILLASMLALGTIANACFADQLVFDNISNVRNGVVGAQQTATGSTPNTIMGDGYRLAAGTTHISGFDLAAVNLTGSTYSNLKFNVKVFDDVNTGVVNAATPAFSNLLGSYSFDAAAGAYASGFYYYFGGSGAETAPFFQLPNALTITDSTIGISIDVLGSNDGINFANANNLTSLITYGTPASVGANVFNGYYRNANNEINGNFTSTLRSLGFNNQSVALRVFSNDGGNATNIPEPASILIMGLGLGALALARRKRACT